MYWDPADFAVGAVRDAPVHLGDRVAVFGLGAIGLMVAQLARICGARWVVAVDPIERRRAAAQRHGADLALDPTAVDAGLEIKQRTDKIGADIVFETSGNYRAFEDAMRSTCYSGTLVSTAYYHGDQGLRLAGEWHRNRINVRSSRACSEPLPSPAGTSPASAANRWRYWSRTASRPTTSSTPSYPSRRPPTPIAKSTNTPSARSNSASTTYSKP